MSAFGATRREPGSGKTKASSELHRIISKFPAYGKSLADRLRWKNPPELVFIEVGGDDAWRRAKKWQCYPDFASLVLTPDSEPKRLIWPVFGSTCLIEWGISAPEALIIELVSCLLRSGASIVAVMPMWVDHDSPTHLFDPSTQTFVQVRECMRVYRAHEEVRHVA